MPLRILRLYALTILFPARLLVRPMPLANLVLPKAFMLLRMPTPIRPFLNDLPALLKSDAMRFFFLRLAILLDLHEHACLRLQQILVLPEGQRNVKLAGLNSQ